MGNKYRMGALSHLNQYFWKYKWLLFLGIFFTVCANFFGVVPAQLVRYALDLVTETIDVYFLFKGFRLQTVFYEVFASTLFYYGMLIVLMALIKGVFLFLIRQTLKHNFPTYLPTLRFSTKTQKLMCNLNLSLL